MYEGRRPKRKGENREYSSYRRDTCMNTEGQKERARIGNSYPRDTVEGGKGTSYMYT